MNRQSTSLVPRMNRRVLLLVGIAAMLGAACIRTRAPSIATNAPAPAFALPDSAGQQVSLATLTANGPAVIAFYRGYW
jgi:AhpC/TSA family